MESDCARSISPIPVTRSVPAWIDPAVSRQRGQVRSHLRSPMFQFNAGVERQLNKSLAFSANYINTRGIKLFRSRDINAPLPPYLERPDPTIGVLREIESAARGQTHALELMLRGKVTRYFNGTIQYNLGRAYNNTGGINVRPANNYDLTGSGRGLISTSATGSTCWGRSKRESG